MSRPPALFEAWHGLGDGVYERPFVKVLAERYQLWVETPWPELYEDLDVRFAEPKEQWRTQAKNSRAQPKDRWSEVPEGAEVIKPYILHDATDIVRGIARGLPVSVDELVYDMPHFDRPELPFDDPYAVVRPCCVRKEWKFSARNPRAEYVHEASQLLRANGIKVISVADLEAGEEWAEDPLPEADVVWHAGELGIRELLGLTQHAAVVVGAVGWILPTCVAFGTPLVTIGGGAIGRENIERLVPDPPMDRSRLEWIMPDEPCMCRNMTHDCEKTISGFGEKFGAALGRLGVAG